MTLSTACLLDDPDMHIPGGLTVTRTSFSTTQDKFGDFAPDAPTAVPIDPIMVHTASGRDLLQLDEADRQTETIKVYTKVRVFCDSGTQDFLAYNSRTWKFSRVKDYLTQGGVFISLALLQEEVQP